MPFDLSEHLATTTRRVRVDARDGRSVTTVVVSRVHPVAVEELWEAIVRPERLSRWFLPVSGDLRPGGTYRLEGNASGRILACERPRRIALTWEYGGASSRVEVRLAPEAEGTRVELEHEAADDPAFAARYGPGATGVGWDMAFLGLARHLADPDARPSHDDAAWASSDEAMGFYRVASDAWARAAIDAGTPPAKATAAAERTRALYSGDAAQVGGAGG